MRPRFMHNRKGSFIWVGLLFLNQNGDLDQRSLFLVQNGNFIQRVVNLPTLKVSASLSASGVAQLSKNRSPYTPVRTT
ncbi:hypothetical protein PF005_g9878 [Phytophthora fragariae]|uniref:Uncharacterized protein n=1 Tax=Phytophthora fragariae TaxID=53985 RepID=A0A6A4A7K2_9STRA|nr:hypothetical protein PF003_g29425 [Phytophthora fragariae]KAE8944970.1 hypothetical protein PF009_g5363 [Phytophthora fragariae]KAE9028718.1 hypothetical protein PF011_g1444 [Phytophthora fragariae]KAE9115921.1 hypothetical protein PF007_g9854 [Phytophthora fragariae]KAE9151489.1 hypothetical protein PF006_g4219 [Phytophthora fragariae]